MVSPAINPTSPPQNVYRKESYPQTQNGTTPETSSNNARTNRKDTNTKSKKSN
jgi:hypothetical protein